MALPTPDGTHTDEPHAPGLAQRLNWLRAGVLGANDGIVSTAAVVVGVAGATSEVMPVFLAGSAALVGGAISMALGEYVSVSSQRDSEHALIEKERGELRADPEGEFAKDALKAHLSAELNIDQDDVVSPWHAALASAIAFTIGALLPMATILLVPHPTRILATFVAVLLALAVTGYVAAWIGGARRGRAVVRILIGGAVALGATFLVGTLFGTTVG